MELLRRVLVEVDGFRDLTFLVLIAGVGSGSLPASCLSALSYIGRQGILFLHGAYRCCHGRQRRVLLFCQLLGLKTTDLDQVLLVKRLCSFEILRAFDTLYIRRKWRVFQLLDFTSVGVVCAGWLRMNCRFLDYGNWHIASFLFWVDWLRAIDAIDCKYLSVGNGGFTRLRSLLKRVEDELLAVFTKCEFFRFLGYLLGLIVFFFESLVSLLSFVIITSFGRQFAYFFGFDIINV